MALPCEIGHHGSCCRDCDSHLELRVCKSAAGYYLGTWCKCGPYSRESGYYATKEEAEDALHKGTTNLRNTGWLGVMGAI